MRIYFVGAHSTGKTTLARHFAAKLGVPLLTETVRKILASREITLAKVRCDIGVACAVQDEICESQIASENGCESFVSDRGFDFLAYTAEHSTNLHGMFNSLTLNTYLDRVATGLIFFVRPHRQLLTDDGVREATDWDAVCRIDGMIKFVLESHGMEYVPVSMLSMQERVRLVELVIRLRTGSGL